MSCCFPQKDRIDPHTLASEDLTPPLQLIDIRSLENTCSNLQTILIKFLIFRTFNNMCRNFLTRPRKNKRTRALTITKRNRIQREIQALQDMNSTKYPRAGLQPLN